jgi:hypothetical protein
MTALAGHAAMRRSQSKPRVPLVIEARGGAERGGGVTALAPAASARGELTAVRIGVAVGTGAALVLEPERRGGPGATNQRRSLGASRERLVAAAARHGAVRALEGQVRFRVCVEVEARGHEGAGVVAVGAGPGRGEAVRVAVAARALALDAAERCLGRSRV